MEDAKEAKQREEEERASKQSENSGTYFNPNDPTKFYQPPQDSTMQDAITLTGFLAVLYFLSKALQEVANLQGGM
jgi:hypothetical protein